MRDILAGEEDGKFNIHSGSRDPRARLLSNFAARPFSYLGRWFGSTEGFIQGIKFPEGDDRRKRAFVSSGEHAKRLGVGAKREFAWWNGQIIPYGSDDHQSLIVEAIECKFTQNPDCRTALMETHGLELVHETGTAESATTSLPAKRFCEILTKIRDRGRSGSARFAHRSLEAFVGRTGCLDSGRGGPFGYEP